MKRIISFLGLCLASHSILAADLPQLMTIGPALKSGQGFAASAPAGVYAVRLNTAIQDISVGSEVQLALPGGTYTVVFERKQSLPSGNLNWIGYLKESGKDYRVILTTGSAGTSGRILTPAGEYLIEPSPEGDRLIDVKASGLKQRGPGKNDEVMVPAPQHEFKLQQAPSQQNSFAAAPAPQTTVDVMVVYTPGMVTAQGSAGAVRTRIDQLVALANQAYIDSDVAITLRLVHTAQVSYTDTNDNSVALVELKNGAGALSGVAALRNTYGADLVALLRPFNSTYQTTCGVGYVPWTNGVKASDADAHGYSVVSDGNDGSFTDSTFTDGAASCVQYTFAHELGHNMGSRHDHANVSDGNYGAYPYSFGYGIPANFGTVMSYITPMVGRFSNPLQSTCGTTNNLICGVPGTDQNTSADNTQSLNNTRTIIAAFRSAATPASVPTLSEWALIAFSLLLAALGLSLQRRRV